MSTLNAVERRKGTPSFYPTRFGAPEKDKIKPPDSLLGHPAVFTITLERKA
jgi:hypothetical protein